MNSLPYYVDFNPVAIPLGPIAVHWYGVMYLLAFGAFWLLGRYRAGRPDSPVSPEKVGDLLFWGVVGVIVGGRMGYVLFYGLDQWAADPLFPVKLQKGGMSFHGGLLGVTVALIAYGRHLGCGLLRLADFAAPLVPIGLALGRVGNFIGGELWGRKTDSPLGMIFPESIEPGGRTSQALYEQYQAGLLNEFARHPSQLYQAAGEGLALFVIVWWFSSRPRPAGSVAGLFLAGYAIFRGISEFFREPDAHLGFLAGDWLTMGMLLSIPMLAAGVGLMIFAYLRERHPK